MKEWTYQYYRYDVIFSGYDRTFREGVELVNFSYRVSVVRRAVVELGPIRRKKVALSLSEGRPKEDVIEPHAASKC